MADLDAQPRAITVVTDDTTREQLAIKIAAELHRAKRVVPKVRTFTEDAATVHELHHERLDVLVADWLKARG